MTKHRVCPVERAGHLEGFWRKILQNPKRILKGIVKKGMTVLDVGCGPGFFSVEMAKMGAKVIAADLQEGMLDKLRNKIKGTNLDIKTHKTEKNKIGVKENVDFVLAFYLVHEVPSQEDFFREIFSILNKKGQLLIVEPSSRVTKKEFQETIENAEKAGFKKVRKVGVFLSKGMLLEK